MKTIESCKRSRKSWIRNWSNIIFVVGVMSLVYLTYLTLEKEIEANRQLRSPAVIYVGDKMLLIKNIKRDTINIVIKKVERDTIEIKDSTTYELDK